MSGYERSDSPERPERPDREPDREPDRDETSARGPIWPEDFSADEREFAAELRALFPIEDEVLPPLYVQTLLDDDSRAPLRRGYTRRLISQVMRRLDLPRTLPRTLTPRGARFSLPDAATLREMAEPVRRAGAPVIAALSLLMALVIGSVYLATPSFAEGLRLLLGQTGAQQITGYPTIDTRPGKPHSKSPAASPAAPVYWLGLVNSGYTFSGMSQMDQQDWSNGPVLDVQYSLTQPAEQGRPATTSDSASASKTGATTPTGSGLLDIREFQISNDYQAVLLAVQDGSATMTTVSGQPAVYVDGMWALTPGGRKAWQSGIRSMLIFERNGVIFWITGDQRDGLTEYPLTQIAAQLSQTTLSALRPNRLTARFLTSDPDANIRAPLGANTDALDLIPRGDGSSTPEGRFIALGLPVPSLMN